MSARFNTILVPVDFSVNTEVAIAKALELMEEGQSVLHLLHVQRRSWSHSLNQYISGRDNDNRKKLQHKLDEFIVRISKIRPDVEVTSWLAEGSSVEAAISQKAMRLGVHLIIIGKHSSGSLFSFPKKVISARIAVATGIPVLTAKPGSLNSAVKTVVLPVGPKFPWKKLELLDAWKNKPGFCIRLVACLNHEEDDEFSKDSLLNTFRLLKSNWPGPVEYDVIRNNNQVKALLSYCNKVNADMLIVYPGVETAQGGLLNRHIADLLPSNSRTQVLAIQPA